ncbi:MULTISPECIES: hypothetical protein [unclassified Rhizobacter]|uniref:hypothetical protein n=1 Tax=unclassified Rhizobacter TaxID=2640088 RepID=UPI0006F1C578|nr:MULTISPECIES: hypothetical protein [unclassified Rhizobacter]KQU66112.1 hypothetical protein ASC88_11145 [Rhizobacter sp. Root29]KQV97750.1 hypothetical protein ASC98_10500 [Rhizobacter sp. Root1238]KRB18866.1 hypothetical protein ASE08_06555 [Rhizobacter sp. Root16D2]
MAHLGIKQAFAIYGAALRNVQWSVSAWTPDGSLVVSLWAHHCRKGPDGTVDYVDSLARWGGPGNTEFRRNIAEAFAQRSQVRLVVASTVETLHVQSGADASKVKKDFDARTSLVGEVMELDGDRYVIRFSRSSSV